MDQTKAKNGNRDEGESPEHAGCRLVGGATGTWYLAAWAARRGTRGASCYGAKLINFCFGLKLRRSRWSRFLAISLFDFLLSTENRLLADLSCETVFLLNTTSTSES